MIRYLFVILTMGLIGLAIVIKASYTMFAERQYWQDVADRFVKENVPVSPNRGNIISADGKLMASSLPEYRIYMDFKAGGVKKDTMLRNHINEISQGMHRIFPDKSSAYFKKHILNGRTKGSRRYPLYPKRISYIQLKEVRKLPVFNLHKYTSGLYAEEYNQRKKPFGSLAARTLGELYGDTAKGARNGIELAFDSVLRGKPGITRRQKIKNRYLNIEEIPPVDGCDVVSTIDMAMQDICEKALVDKLVELDATEGVVVLMEVATGDVKAIVNMTKDRDGKYRELRNGAISNMMEPGSTFKTASMMVAMEDGYVTMKDGVNTGDGKMEMHGRTMRDHNWRKGGYHYLTVPQIMMKSSNIGVAYLIDKYYGNNPDKFVDGLHRMGLNQPLNIQIPGEGIPNIRRPKDGRWSKTALPWMSIGYETQIPPLHILTFYNAIANDGVMMKPRFVKEVVKDGEVVEEFPTEILNASISSKKTLDDIRSILRMVVSEGLGAPAGSNQFSVSGKTGTAQISKGKAGYRSGTMNYLVSFCGYFPSEAPLYSCIVSIQKPNLPAAGGQMAGSVFGKIAERIYAKNLVLDIKNAVDNDNAMMPLVKPGELTEARNVLKELGIKSQVKFTAETNEEVWGNVRTGNKEVVLERKDHLRDFMPNVTGMGVKDAVYLLEKKGLKVTVSGLGKVYNQSVEAGVLVKNGQKVHLNLKQ